MNTNLSSTELRQWAARCDARRKDPMISGDEHERLTKMRDGLLALAETQDWLDGTAMKKAG